jgi:hypothetical protein
MVLIAGFLIFAFISGFCLACFTEGSSRADLEHENWNLEIENQRLKRGLH